VDVQTRQAKSSSQPVKLPGALDETPEVVPRSYLCSYINIYLVLVATTENQDHQSTEAQHGELEEIHCASSLGGESSYIAAFQYINSPNQVL